MKPTNPQKKQPDSLQKARLWRAEPEPEVDIFGVDEGHGWAVSYSDLLMVLMSFFIIFFSYQDEKPKDLLEGIAVSIVKNGGMQDKQEPKTEKNQKAETPPAPPQIAPNDPTSGAKPTTAKDLGMALNQALKRQNITVETETTPTSIKVSFKDDLYKSRAWQLTSTSKTTINRVLDLIYPYKDKLNVDVIGQTDSTPVNPKKGDLVTNNFILSSLRASAALDYLLQRGFSKDHIQASGIADIGTSGRTLSIRFSLRNPGATQPPPDVINNGH